MFQTTLREFAEATARLNAVANGTWLLPLATRLRIALHSQHTRRIAAEKRDPDGRPWKKLASSTLVRKRGSMLVETGRLLGSLTSEQTGLIVKEGNQAAPYNVFIQGGTQKMPARPYMGIGNPGLKEIEKICRDFIRARL